MKRRTEITVEEQIRIVRRAGASSQVSCPVCGVKTWMVTPDDAALAAGVNARAIYRWVEEGRIHFRETPQGTLQICLSSLREQLKPG